MNHALQAVIFDLDGTLVDSERDNIESVVRAMRRLGHEITKAERDFIVGHAWNEIYARLRDAYALSVSMPALIESAVEEKDAIVAQNGVRELPGAVGLVRRLAARVPLAIASGSSVQEIHDMVAALGLTDCFQIIVGAEDYERGKPDPQPYALAMERLGVTGQGSVVFEDAPPGIESARSAGAAVIGVMAGNYAGFDLSRAHAVVPSLQDVHDALFDRVLSMR